MIRTLLSAAFLALAFLASAQPAYRPLDSKQPVRFLGDRIVFNRDTITLGPRAFFIDGSLADSMVAKYHYVFNSVNKAATQLADGTEAEPMTLYLAPWVYWIDNPDDTAVRVPKDGTTPYGLVIKCEWLRFHGLTNNPQNVVLASNRGQTIGAQGNFTMFRFIGQGTGSENVTFGNYCNVDLVYPLKPELGRPKRASAIVQAQLIHCNGDKIVARNTRFISRLNLCPFVGGKRVLFDRCHFESTDDALCGTGVYLDCTLDFYASKPFYNTTGTGAVLLNCDIRSFAGDRQYFTKAGGRVALIDCRLSSAENTYWGWQEVVPREARNYQANVTLNGKPLFIGKADPASTVDLSNKPLLAAYRFTANGKVVYNTYNLLRGTDNWDPMGIKPLVLAAEKTAGTSYSNLPVALSLSPNGAAVETGKNTVQLTPAIFRFANAAAETPQLSWEATAKDKALVQLKVSGDGKSCTVVPASDADRVQQVVVRAYTQSGLEGASLVNVSPAILDAPAFAAKPRIVLQPNGKLRVDYNLAAKFTDESDVRWYRSRTANGNDAVEVAVSRRGIPLREYNLSTGDVGYYLVASVAPKHVRSKSGEPVRIAVSAPIKSSDVKAPSSVLETDFRNLSTKNQPLALPGFWTWDYLKTAALNDPRAVIDPSRDAWTYGEGSEGAAGLWGLLQGRSAAMRYVPVGNRFGNMSLVLNLAPFKTAGQGFSVAHLYMDVLIKYDPATKTGYGLRLLRTTKYHDAVDCMLLKIENGEATPIGEAVSTSAFRTPCTVSLALRGNKLSARITTSAPAPQTPRPGVVNDVALQADVAPNSFGTFGIDYNGGSPTLVQHLKATWK